MDLSGRRRHASPEALTAALRALGAPIRSGRDAADAVRQKERDLSAAPVPPVQVCWDGDTSRVRGKRMPKRLPLGYHRLTVESRGVRAESLLISAPRFAHPLSSPRKQWGIFLPPYAACSGWSWGAGDLSDLRRLARWTGRMGGRVLGTLPLLPLFLDRPYDPSPYAPVSRLFWGEFWLDVESVAELRGCRPARRLLASAGFQRELDRLRRAPRVDYRGQMMLKRRLLEELAGGFFAHGTPGRARAFRNFLRERPEVTEYAAFRAKGEGRGPAAYRAQRYHAYVQWLMEDQMRHLAAGARRSGVGLYFDLPLGVHPEGYDIWREPQLFARGATAGAPPDPFFRQGQDWGFPPLHPERIRQEGFGYFAACLRHSMRHASLLRIDHVMGLHRLFWVPRGFPAREGVYVRYPAEELFAVLCLESHRSRCAVVGEDLGTVPPETRRALRRHRLSGMFVVQYEWSSDARRRLRTIPSDAVASLNTHDMPPFAEFLRLAEARGGVGGRRRALLAYLRRAGWEGPEGASAQRLAAALLCVLARAAARLLLVNPEDLWGERRPHNVPGTWRRMNWTRKMRLSLEEMCADPLTRERLRRISALRCRS